MGAGVGAGAGVAGEAGAGGDETPTVLFAGYPVALEDKEEAYLRADEEDAAVDEEEGYGAAEDSLFGILEVPSESYLERI